MPLQINRLTRVKALLALFLFCMATVTLRAQPDIHDTPDDRILFDEYLAYIRAYRSSPSDIVLERTALFFLGRPYVAHTLEMGDEEQLVVNLRAFDCTTFVETVIALSRTASGPSPSFETFRKELQAIRYRDGDVDGYTSRLHYASDWVYENERKGLLRNLSGALGGVKEKKLLHFMSSHREAYRRIKTDDEMLGRIVATEEKMNRRGGFYYLPKERIAVVSNRIPHLSVILFTTGIEGLDVTHMAFACRKGEKLTFIHASSAAKKVVEEEKTVSDYCLGQRSCTGIIVAEINCGDR